MPDIDVTAQPLVSVGERAKFKETSNHVRGAEATIRLLAEAREMYVEMKKRGEL